MNRRSLFKLLAGAACAAAIEITGLRPLMPKAAQYVINPEYANAAYEDLVVSFTPPYEGMGFTLQKYPTKLRPTGPWKGAANAYAHKPAELTTTSDT